MHFSHLKEHIPWREKTKKDNKQKERREGRERGKKDSDIKSFKLCVRATHIVQKERPCSCAKQMRDRCTVSREEDKMRQLVISTKQTKLKTVTKIKSALEKYALMNEK